MGDLHRYRIIGEWTYEPDFEGYWVEYSEAAAALKAAEAERDLSVSVEQQKIAYRDKMIAGLEADLAAARSEIERLREGLRPFADTMQSDSADGTQRVKQAWLTRTRELVYPEQSSEPEFGRALDQAGKATT